MSIDIPADLNMEDDFGRGLARLPTSLVVHLGDMFVAGRPGFRARVVVEEVTSDGIVYFRQVGSDTSR